MPRCTVDADFLKSVLEEAKAAERWAEATYQLFMKKGEITEYAMRRIQYTESILNIPFHRKTLAELESGEWLNENCVTLEMQLKSCQHLCEITATSPWKAYHGDYANQTCGFSDAFNVLADYSPYDLGPLFK